MPEGLDPEVLLASTARFLVDGGEEDAANVLLSCSMKVWGSGDTWYEGDETISAVHVELTGPRASYEALNRETTLDAYYDFIGMPQEMREQQKGLVGILDEDLKKLPPIVMPAIERAIKAVLPSEYYVKHLTTHASLVEIDPDWREELLEIARGKGVHNQAITDRKAYTWQNLNFRSKSEIRIAEALDRASVLFFPNCRGRVGMTADYRVNREPDFLICNKGKWGILEVDGEPFHPPERTAEEHERDRLFRAHGIRVVEHFDATRCYQTADDVVAEFLRILGQS